jgi:hypothetical protein
MGPRFRVAFAGTTSRLCIRATRDRRRTDLPAMANQIRAFGLRQINPMGKSLLIFRNRVKPRNQKYFLRR